LFLPGTTSKDKPLSFEGDREHDAIAKWIKRKLSPPAQTLSKQEELDTTLKTIHHELTPEGLGNKNLDAISAVVGLFSDDSQLVAFEKVAGEDVEKHFYFKIVDKTFLSQVEKTYSVKAPCTLVFNAWAEAPKVISDAAVLADKTKLMDAVTAETVPPSDVVTIATEEEFKAAVESKIPHVVEFYAPWCSYCTPRLLPAHTRTRVSLCRYTQMRHPTTNPPHPPTHLRCAL
jgi:hypothetical protein